MNKSYIRNQIKLFRQNMSKELVVLNSSEIIKKLFNMEEYKNAERIYLYSPIQNEVRTNEILDNALLNKKEVAYPLVKEDTMQFYKIKSISDLTAGYMNILEPSEKSEISLKPGLVLVPGIAFDNKLNRIGFGKGFYDKWLTDNINNCLIGLAYDFQIVDTVYPQKHDIKMNYIITEKRIISN